jgi:hypothetical protein
MGAPTLARLAAANSIVIWRLRQENCRGVPAEHRQFNPWPAGTPSASLIWVQCPKSCTKQYVRQLERTQECLASNRSGWPPMPPMDRG